MRKLGGVLLILAGIALGIWLDVFVFLIGGINEVTAGFAANPDNVHQIVWGFIRCIGFTGMGLAAAIVCGIAGGALLVSAKGKHRRR